MFLSSFIIGDGKTFKYISHWFQFLKVLCVFLCPVLQTLSGHVCIMCRACYTAYAIEDYKVLFSWSQSVEISHSWSPYLCTYHLHTHTLSTSSKATAILSLGPQQETSQIAWLLPHISQFYNHCQAQQFEHQQKSWVGISRRAQRRSAGLGNRILFCLLICIPGMSAQCQLLSQQGSPLG